MSGGAHPSAGAAPRSAAVLGGGDPKDSRPVLVLGLGNPIVTDDAVGLLAAREVRARLTPEEAEVIEVLEAEIAGFALIDLLADRPGAVILDALEVEGAAPGAIVERSLEDFRPTARLVAGHQIDLPTALALGRELGRAMPADVVVIAVVVEDARTFGETPTPAVAAAVGPAAERALAVARGLVPGRFPEA